ncbi:N-acyl-D-amino-acid deacylase family protein [Sphingomonas bacterium]|uniref:N-acyl-D-amino-acid deacylase family protein n=1 Tax=Sphingomonas bacterium TaxID=1895847 RepID=UPI001576C0EC|nr:amidohydrolase family protein [Sphingomonas bacterium]
MYDIIIRGGTVVDGTGAAPHRADVAISAGKIAAIGTIDGAAREVIEAEGALVTPGFIDIHTHYDGQFIWDDTLEPSFSNGVTTAIAGNCGVGFAPVQQKDRTRLVEMMEGVEDIPGIVLDEGLDWSWTSFPDYLDRLDRRRYTMDVAAHLPHAPLRVFVMGDRGLAHEPANDDDLAEMQRVVREAMAAGAVGVSGSRILEHKSSKGEFVPGTFAEDRELIAIAEAMGETGKGVFQIVPLGCSGDTVGTQIPTEERLSEHDRFERIAEACGRPVTYLLHSHNHAPEEWREMIAASEAAQRRGLDIHPQVAARGVGLLLSLDGYHIFQARPSYMAIAHLPRAERAAAMRVPERRAAILSEANVGPDEAPTRRILGLAERFAQVLDRFYVMQPPVNYEPDESLRLDRIATATGRTMDEVLYDTLADGDGSRMVADFAMNYTGGNLDSVHDMLAHPDTISGLGDGGAHLLMVCDAAMTTFHLSFWARDRSRGPTLPVEAMVAKLTGKSAEVYGLHDRGVIAVGKRADINVIDFEKLDSEMPEMVFDLPLGSGRLVQRATGYRATMVNGVVTRRNDLDTGARPGRLVRAGHAEAA